MHTMGRISATKTLNQKLLWQIGVHIFYLSQNKPDFMISYIIYANHTCSLEFYTILCVQITKFFSVNTNELSMIFTYQHLRSLWGRSLHETPWLWRHWAESLPTTSTPYCVYSIQARAYVFIYFLLFKVTLFKAFGDEKGIEIRPLKFFNG